MLLHFWLSEKCNSIISISVGEYLCCSEPVTVNYEEYWGNLLEITFVRVFPRYATSSFCSTFRGKYFTFHCNKLKLNIKNNNTVEWPQRKITLPAIPKSIMLKETSVWLSFITIMQKTWLNVLENNKGNMVLYLWRSGVLVQGINTKPQSFTHPMLHICLQNNTLWWEALNVSYRQEPQWAPDTHR